MKYQTVETHAFIINTISLERFETVTSVNCSNGKIFSTNIWYSGGDKK